MFFFATPCRILILCTRIEPGAFVSKSMDQGQFWKFLSDNNMDRIPEAAGCISETCDSLMLGTKKTKQRESKAIIYPRENKKLYKKGSLAVNSLYKLIITNTEHQPGEKLQYNYIKGRRGCVWYEDEKKKNQVFFHSEK